MTKKYDYQYNGHKTECNEFLYRVTKNKRGDDITHQLLLMGWENNYLLAVGDEEEFVNELDAIISYLSAIRQDIGVQQTDSDDGIPF